MRKFIVFMLALYAAPLSALDENHQKLLNHVLAEGWKAQVEEMYRGEEGEEAQFLGHFIDELLVGQSALTGGKTVVSDARKPAKATG